MARQHVNMPSVNQEFETVLLDEDGQPILTVSMHTYMIQEPDGSITKKKRSQKLPLMCGMMWDPSLSMPPKVIVRLAICRHCRRPPWSWPRRRRQTHGLMSQARARVCVTCGSLCCPQHSVRCSDGQWRCVGVCARRYRFWTVLLHIFCTRG